MIQTALVFMFMSTSLLAQNSQDKVAKARDAIEKAQQFLTNKRYDQAIKEFQTAHRLQPDLQNLIMIANLYGKLNLCMDSIQTWQDALEFCQNCEDRQIIMQKQQKILEKCYVSVSFSSNPIGIEVFQNQNRLGMTPLIKPFTLGEYTLEFKKEGFEDHRETIFVSENDLKQKGKLVHIDLIPISHMLQPQNLNSNPESKVEDQKPSSKKKIVAYSLLATSLALLAFDLYYYVDQQEWC
jgi:tetratricopeptide (TPR) repeat protein